MRKVVLFGKGELAVFTGEALLDLGYEISFVVPVIPEPIWTESLSSWAQSKSLHVIQSGSLSDLPNSHFDLGISIYFDKIFKSNDIQKFSILVNLHNSALPKYKGINPINWALENNERKHGVTLHKISESIDAGPILAQTTFSIFPEFEEVRDVYRRCILYGKLLISEHLKNIDKLEPVYQEQQENSYYSMKDQQKLKERVGWARS